MTEYEYIIEMLCQIPKSLLQKRINNNPKIPNWLKNVSKETVKDALTKYDEIKYVEMRKEESQYII